MVGVCSRTPSGGHESTAAVTARTNQQSKCRSGGGRGSRSLPRALKLLGVGGCGGLFLKATLLRGVSCTTQIQTAPSSWNEHAHVRLGGKVGGGNGGERTHDGIAMYKPSVEMT